MLRFEKGGGGATYPLGRPISALSGAFTDDSRLPEVQVFAEKYDGILFDATDFLESMALTAKVNKQLLDSITPTLCGWLAGNII